jgi:hypothetical protein
MNEAVTNILSRYRDRSKPIPAMRLREIPKYFAERESKWPGGVCRYTNQDRTPGTVVRVANIRMHHCILIRTFSPCDYFSICSTG